MSCSELPCFHIRSQNQFTIQVLSHGLSAPFALVAVAVWRDESMKRVVQSVSPSSGYAYRYVQCCVPLCTMLCTVMYNVVYITSGFQVH